MKLSAPPPPPPEPEPAAPADAPTPAAEAPAPAAPPEPPALATWPGWLRGFDFVLAAMAVGLAFLLASFAARNSDVWVHLAAGRHLAHFDYRFGADPFSYTGADRAWVNHSWLYDLASYLVYSAGGGFALVLVKALEAAAVVGLLLATWRPGRAFWPWVLCAAVAAVACAPRLTLTPHVGSMLYLAVLMVLLFRVPYAPGSWRLPAAVGVLFWVWASTDKWFLLGPLALALVLAGEAVQNAVRGPDPDDADAKTRPGVRELGIALGVGVLAATLTPHHVRIWQLPVELTTAAEFADPLLKRELLLFGPLDSTYRDATDQGNNLNGLAYAGLLVAGVLTLGFGPGRLRAGEIALWVGFAAISLWSVAAIPFFAVVAVPVVAAQLAGFGANLTLGPKTDPKTRGLLAAAVGGRVAGAVLLTAALVAAWPGNLHPTPRLPSDARHVAWAVEPDPSLEAAAKRIEGWRAAGQLPPEARGFFDTPDLANHCAWFAPGERVYLNGRPEFHRPEAAAYGEARRGLGLWPGDDSPPGFRAAAEVFRAAGVGYFASTEPFRVNPPWPALDRLWRETDVWAAWAVEGRVTVAGWRPDRGADAPAFERLRLDPVRAAFDPAQTPVPAGKVHPLPRPEWYDEFAGPPPASPPAAAEALTLARFKRMLEGRATRAELARRWLLTNVPGGAPPLGAGLYAQSLDTAVRQGAMAARPPADGSFPAAALLTLRAARRAVADSPDHPDGYYALAVALADPDLPVSALDRRLGRIAALRQCLSRMPPPDEFRRQRERYRRNPYLANPEDVSGQLTVAYWNPVVQARKDGKPEEVPRGVPLEDDVLADLVGVRLPDGRGGTRVLPFLLPADLARQAMKLTIEYAAASPDVGEDRVAALKQQQQAVDKVVGELVGQYRDRAGPLRPAQRFDAARQSGLVGEALDLLDGMSGDDLGREFSAAGRGPIDVGLQKVALELCVGRLEQADQDIHALKEALAAAPKPADPRAAGRAAEYQAGVRYLEAVKARLAGDYPTAAEVLGDELKARAGRRPPPPPPQARAALALGDNWLLVATAGGVESPVGLMARYKVGQLQFTEADAIRDQAVVGPLQREAGLFVQLGLMQVYQGKIADARTQFEAAALTPPAGWNLPPIRPETAAVFLGLIDRAAKPPQP